jgi:hypothetical protein
MLCCVVWLAAWFPLVDRSYFLSPFVAICLLNSSSPLVCRTVVAHMPLQLLVLAPAVASSDT